jgi:GNAT superfamily N-acetyltransferase
VNIRQASVQETDIIIDVLGEAAHWLEERDIPLWDEDELAPEQIASDVAKGLYFIADCLGNTAGVMRFQDEDALFWPEALENEAAYIHRLAAYIHRLAVRRKHAGTGVSTALLRWAVERARSLGLQYLRLDCDASRPRLRAIYEAFGFHHRDDKQVGPYFVSRYELDVGRGES